MTAKKSIGKDAEKVFRSLWAGDFVRDTEKLLVAPKELQDGIIALIDGEIEKAKAGKSCYIGMKVNAMSDKDIMKKLQEASKAGVKIDLIIRGINCLISQVPGVTENIRVYSIVGRFLEHARIYIFGVGDEEKVYISSADMMSRNTVRRVEVATPIEDAPLRAKIHHVFDLQLQDNVKARVQNSEGIYMKRKPQDGEEARNSQEQMLREMIEAIQ